MSSILKALKKLEHEKSASKHGKAEIDMAILQGEQPPRRSSAKTVLLMSILFACGGAATYFLLSKGPDKSPQGQVAALQPSPATQPLTAQKQVALTNNSTAATPKTAAVGQSKPAVPAAKNIQKKIAKIQPGPSARQLSEAKQKPASEEAAPQHPAVRNNQGSGLTVNGIALSDGEKRKAIVNGATVSKGSYIGGARVEETLENRVRFSKGGRKFDVSVGSSSN